MFLQRLKNALLRGFTGAIVHVVNIKKSQRRADYAKEQCREVGMIYGEDEGKVSNFSCRTQTSCEIIVGIMCL